MKNILFLLIFSVIIHHYVKSQNEMVVIYTKSNCGRCEFAKKYMRENNISFKEYNTSENTEYVKNMYTEIEKTENASNFKLMPVIVYDKNIDYNMDNMKEYMINLKKNLKKNSKHKPKYSENEEKVEIQIPLTDEEKKLYNMIMEYRKEKGLPIILLSKSLTIVAQTHVKDLVINKPDKGECNTHSWSAKGKWTACCYTSDHKKANCMWSKPQELTNYKGSGYEIACGSSAPQFDKYIMTAEYALNSWKNSKGHNTVIVNEGVWKNYTWQAIGIGIYKGFAVVWFGAEEDNQ